MPWLRKTIDLLCLAGGILAAVFLVIILLVICAQMAMRWAGIPFPGSANYAGYCMAASTFLALAYAFNAGAHVRVSLFLQRMGRFQRLGEIWCYLTAATIMTFFAWSALERNIQTWEFKFRSQGLDATPLWIPELGMTLGAILFSLTLWHHLLHLVTTRNFKPAEANPSRDMS